MTPKEAKVLKYTLSAVIAAVLVWFAFRKVEWTMFWDILKDTSWIYIFPFFAASLAALALRMLRWKALLYTIDIDVPLSRIWHANNAGNLANIVLPGAGEFVRCGYVAGKARYDTVLGTEAMERVWDVIAIIVVFAVALATGWGRFGSFFVSQIWTPVSESITVSAWWLIAAAVALIAAAVLAVLRFRSRNAFFGRMFHFLEELRTGFTSFIRMDRKWLFGLYTAALWLMYVFMCFCIIRAIPVLHELGFADALFISAIGNIASVIPVPGGVGAYHYIVALALSSIYGAGWDTGLIFATLNHELHAAMIILLGIISYLALTLRKK